MSVESDLRIHAGNEAIAAAERVAGLLDLPLDKMQEERSKLFLNVATSAFFKTIGEVAAANLDSPVHYTPEAARIIADKVLQSLKRSLDRALSDPGFMRQFNEWRQKNG